MTKSERIAKKISEQISTWSKVQDKLVLAIDGYAGSGKTTIADYITKQNTDILTIHLDDFIQHWKNRKKMIEREKDKAKVFEYNWYRYGDLEKLVKEFKSGKKKNIKLKTYDFDKNNFDPEKIFNLSKKVLVIEGIFLFHPEHEISKMWDKTIYLETDLDKADKRRVAREKKKWGKDYLPETHPDNWTKYYKEAYRLYIKEYKPEKNRDLVFNV